MKPMAVRSLDETSPSSSLSAAAVSSRKGTPKGLPALLNKLVRAVLISKPLQAATFLADYLDAELNRRTLCQLQDLEMTVCDLEVFDSEKVDSPSSRTTRAARKEQLHDNVSASNDEQSAKGCARNLESKCVAVQTDRNHLRYMTKSPFLQKMEAELISSVVENLNQDHECRCNCPPPPLFWYQITRPQVLRKCRGSQTVRKKIVASTADDKPAAGEDEGDKEVELLEKKTDFSIDDKAAKLHADNDAGLARIIDRELRAKKWQRLPTPPRPPPPPPPLRPKTPPPVERPLKLDASCQVETLVIQHRPRRDVDSPDGMQDEIVIEPVEVEHKYVQTMDDDLFRPEERAVVDQSDMPSSDPIALVCDGPSYQDLDVPACIACPDAAVNVEDESPPPPPEPEPTIDWSPFWVPPLQSRSSTEWLNIDVIDVSDKDYDTDWDELTRAVVRVAVEEPLINWLAIDLQPQPMPHTCGKEAPPPPASPTPSESDTPSLFPHPSSPAPSLSSVQEDAPAVQPSADLPDDDVPAQPMSGRESPATMMTPDVEDELTGCEDPSMMLGPDEESTMVVLSWKPIIIQSDTNTALPLDIPVMVSQCPQPPQASDYHVLPDIEKLDPQQIVQELTKKWEQIGVIEIVVDVPHAKDASPADALMDRNEVTSTDSIVKPVASQHSAILADDHHNRLLMPQLSDHKVIVLLDHGLPKEKSDNNIKEASPNYETVEQKTSHHEEFSPTDETVKQVSDLNEVLPADEMVTKRSDSNMAPANADMVSDHNVASANADMVTEVSDHNVASEIKGDMQKQVSDMHKDSSLNDDLVEQRKSDHEVEQKKSDHEVEQKRSDHEVEQKKSDHEVEQKKSDHEVEQKRSDHEVEQKKSDHEVEQKKSDHEVEQKKSDHEVEQKKSDMHEEEASPNPETFKQLAYDDEATPTDEAIKQGSVRNDSAQEIEMLKHIFGEEVLSNSSMVKTDATPSKSEEKLELKSHSAELVGNDELRRDEDNKDGSKTEEDGEKQHGHDDDVVENPATDEEEEEEEVSERDRTVHAQ